MALNVKPATPPGAGALSDAWSDALSDAPAAGAAGNEEWDRNLQGSPSFDKTAAALADAARRPGFLSEDGITFVLDTGDAYRELAKNELGEMSLASPAIAGNALYIRTQSKLYKIAN